ncbi:MAG TPA: CPXCG motif-containing cysteine-rich protein [Chthoniobacterales bacterium]|nr:CPXCG motif-containing cysteine-rich protein [Chthoniobacterales bacterium]
MELIHETDIVCPHCGEAFPLQVDTSQAEQRLIEDCSVCCRPIVLTIHCQPGEIESISEAPG